MLLAGLGYDVLAVEPDDGMRAVAERGPPWPDVAGSAEDIPLPDATVDAVVAGQAFHWFDPERRCPRSPGCCGPAGTSA